MMRKLPSSSLLAFAFLLALGCGKRPELGGELGTFHVEATATENECGEGSLGMESAWAFDVELARQEQELHWDNGYDVVIGALEEDEQTFAFDSAFDMDMRTEEDPSWLPPCKIRRIDTATGKLSSSTEDVESFAGEMTYRFEPTAGSDCSDLASAEGPLFLKLPCSVRYEVAAERTRAPGEDGALNEE